MNKRDRLLQLLVAAAVFGCCTTFAGTEVDQGKGGLYGPWKTAPSSCVSATQAVTTVGTSASNCPASQLSSRRFIMLCVSKRAPGAAKVTIRIDGSAATGASGTDIGDVLAQGDCGTYYIPASVTPSCWSDTATTYVTSLECR